MKKPRLIQVLLICLLASLTLVACGDNEPSTVSSKKKGENDNKPTLTVAPTGKENNTPTQAQQTPDNDKITSTPAAQPSKNYDDFGYIAKYSIGDDESQGIYAIVITYSDKVPEKGTLTYKFYNDESGMETTVATYVVNYEKDSNGKFETREFLDGEVYINQHKKDEMKINITFGASIRAKRCELFLETNGKEVKVYEFKSIKN